ncbi:MAG: hypothetical protein MUP97_16005 [Acidimicrobiia bacterium]|nr:hypothetical protein [Acidimicrobiia bacterium]
MKFNRYTRGAIVAYPFDEHGSVGLRYSDGRGLLRTSNGIPRSVVDRSDVADVTVILACITEDLDQAACSRRGVEAVP